MFVRHVHYVSVAWHATTKTAVRKLVRRYNCECMQLTTRLQTLQYRHVPRLWLCAWLPRPACCATRPGCAGTIGGAVAAAGAQMMNGTTPDTDCFGSESFTRLPRVSAYQSGQKIHRVLALAPSVDLSALVHEQKEVGPGPGPLREAGQAQRVMLAV